MVLMKNISDEEIIKLILKNNRKSQKAFAVILDRYSERLYWHVRKIVISHDDADDVVQNTFIKVFRSLHLFRGDSRFYTWLYRIGTNEALSFLQKKKQHQSEDIDDHIVALAGTLQSDEYFDGDDIQQKLQQAIAQLPHKQRVVFNMKYFDDMKYTDMAEILETSVGALKASYHHAVKKIEAYIQNEGSEN
jgi:RNA polymerase sigma factor (sigma-70 family)